MTRGVNIVLIGPLDGMEMVPHLSLVLIAVRNIEKTKINNLSYRELIEGFSNSSEAVTLKVGKA